jgi:hypothetical protein
MLCILLCTCSNSNNNPTFPFERSILDVSIAKRCIDGSSAPGANCYLIRWQHPIEKKDLQNYYIWLDTTVVKDSAENVQQWQIDAATAVIPYSGRGDGDSLDLTNLISEFLERDSLHIAIWAQYEGKQQGAVRHLSVFFGDDIPPSMVNFSDSASANTIWIEWIRPTDQWDFYKPEEINGPIAGYNVTIQAPAGEDIRDIPIILSLSGNNVNVPNLRISERFRKEGRQAVLAPAENNDPRILRFAITDGEGFDANNPKANEWKMEILGLKSEQSYSISILAWDIAGNPSAALTTRNIRTTDNIAPLIANEFWLYPDSGDGLPRLDSNRLVLFWPRSVDPLYEPTPIQLNSRLHIPPGCSPGTCYREVERYIVEYLSDNWEAIPRISVIPSDYYNARYRLENNSMVPDPIGEFISDTLRWIAPGESVTLRIRAVDSSGHYSKAWISTIQVSKGELWEKECPQGFMPVKGEEDIFCMERLQHAKGNIFESNVLYIEAEKACSDLGFYLCTERQWNAACTSRTSTYGVIEEREFFPADFLFRHCGVGTGRINERSKLCVSPDGIRDLPGQLQEWVTSNSGTPLLKGTSYVKFEGVSGVELAQCKNRFTPTRIRPKYTTDTVYLYRSGSRIDTLLSIDTLRTLHAILPPNQFTDTLLIYSLKSSAGVPIGRDYVNQAEYRRKGGDKWLEVLWQGLSTPEFIEPQQVLILGDTIINASNLFLDPTVGFRCCTD